MIYEQSDFTIVLESMLALAVFGLLLYWVFRAIFTPFKIKDDPYFGVTIIGTAVSLVAILLIFTLMQAMGSVAHTHKNVVAEIESLYKLKSACLLVSSKDCATIRNAMDGYVRAIFSSDWPKPPDVETEADFERLVVAVSSVMKKMPADALERQNLFLAIDSMIRTRGERMLNEGKEIPKAFYGATGVLICLLVFFYYFLSPKTLFSQVALVVLLSLLGTLLGLVIVYDHPYEGDSGVTQHEFVPALKGLETHQG
jgi:hypothetical protein